LGSALVLLFGHLLGASDRRLPGVRRLIENVDTLDDEKEIAAHFVMSKALSDLKQYDDAFEHLKKASVLKRASIDCDEPQRLAMSKTIEAKFSPDLIKARSGDGDKS
jgi:hypothetical protein